MNPKWWGIHLWVLGQSDVSWAERPGGSRTNFEYEIYMKDCIILWGKDPRQDLKESCPVLQAGSHEYAFTYRLAQCLPSSFESQDARFKGRVHYVLRAALDSTDDVIRQHRDTTVAVLNTLDLNLEQPLREHVQERQDRTTRCCCCRTGIVSCVLRLDRTGFVPGEDISLDAEIHNLSRAHVNSSYVTMQQVVSYVAQGESRSSTTDIFRISGGRIRHGDSAFYHDIIHIPPLPPSRLDHCRLIHIQYAITVGVQPADDSGPVEVSIPITIGTVPLQAALHPNIKLEPCYSCYSHASGEIEDFPGASAHCSPAASTAAHKHVYLYYKCSYQPDPATAPTLKQQFTHIT